MRPGAVQTDVASSSRGVKSSEYLIHFEIFSPLAIVVLRRGAHPVLLSVPSRA